MKKLQLNKLKPQDLEVLNETLELYGAYLFFFIQSEPSQALYIYKSICVELQFMIANKLKVRSLPANTLLNLEQHQAFVFQNALQHLKFNKHEVFNICSSKPINVKKVVSFLFAGRHIYWKECMDR